MLRNLPLSHINYNMAMWNIPVVLAVYYLGRCRAWQLREGERCFIE